MNTSKTKNKYEEVIYALDQLRDLSECILKDEDDIEERRLLTEEIEMYKAYVSGFKSGDILDEDITNALDILKNEVGINMDMVNDAFKENNIDLLEYSASNLFTFTVAYNELLKIQKGRAN